MRTHTIDPAMGIYRSTDDYVHAIEVTEPRRFVFVSGTMGLEVDGRPGDGLERQLELVWDNIERVLDATGLGLGDVMRVTSYLTSAADADLNAAARRRALGGRLVPTTAIVVETLDPDWLIEIEVIAAA